ncbi:Predicted dithiol-disulfide oxidoreductase, DUF899 family [Saccharopolyspora antimicrobica]|uniref:Dithiol-disulfide oxidoreductase (DUF899 family) n=1 Tax=Saccharopolyspora antimicrobica TaxID=455193 RepID=A0A1I4VUQ1_9PSEU|nr:DUF899 domain-containing protein [Saccharopolyspora antimicrobica]RKT87207.1 putative dithiol-disulfide oxidoreductase (DUF899 family) [Saccharopolyspora antimicrobica]SFN04747.1 Predicted dithiol-disulfide oxidoreductase, DUF899 family [Saccharopolyspora antimicrobica]
MSDPEITTREQWLVARRELLAKEKELTRHRDEVNAARRRLPMVEITKDYSFDGPHGRVGLIDLFEGRSQLVIYHAMFDPDADAGCPACSFWLDNVGNLSHLHARDTTFAAVSLAPLEKLERYKQRMGWTVPWYSSYGSEFNYDFHATFDPAIAPVEWNYKNLDELMQDNPGWEEYRGSETGVSAFLRKGDRVFHTYACYGRGIDLLNGTYNYLDLTARGRQEDWEQPPGRSNGSTMSWLRRHDEYDPAVIGGASTSA